MQAKIGNLDNRYTLLPGAYTIAFLPDTQYMTQVAHQSMFLNMMEWIATNKANLNLKAVVGVGDIAQSHLAEEYENAVAGFAKLTAVGVPYITPPGNHDYNSTSSRTLTTYNTYLSPTHYAGKSWYGGAFEEGKGENAYITFFVGSRKYIIFGLEFFPRSQVFTWAQGVIDANPDAYVIMSTHGYMNESDVRLTHGMGGSHGPDSYGLTDPNNYDGQQMWDNFIKINPSIRAVLCGHDTGAPFINDRNDNNTHRINVNQIRSDYQTENYGNGNVVLMEFVPNEVNTITLRVYSTVDDAYVGSPIVLRDEVYTPTLVVDTLKYTTLDPAVGSGGSGIVIVTDFTDEGINAAIDSLGSSGGEVYMPAGEYAVNGPINIDHSNTVLRGAGPLTVLKLPANTNPVNLRMINIDDHNSCTLRDFTIDGNKGQNPTGYATAIDANSGIGHQLLNLRILNMPGGNGTPGGDGLYCTGVPTRWLIDGLYIDGCEDDGLDVNAMQYSTISNNHIRNCGDNGIDTDGSYFLSIVGNTFYNCGGNAIELEDEGSGATQYCSVTGNTIYGTSKATSIGISVTSGRYNTITGNVIIDCVTGVMLAKTSSGLSSIYNIISSNVIKTCTTGVQEGTTNADYNTIVNNDCYSCTTPYTLYGTHTNLVYNDAGVFTVTSNSKLHGTIGTDLTPGKMVTTDEDGALSTQNIPSGGGLIDSVTGLNTDNTDLRNPIVQISVDGSTITGAGTPADPLVANTSGGSDTLQDVTTRGSVTTTTITTTGFLASRTDDPTDENILYYRTDLYEWRVKVGTTIYRVNVSPIQVV